MLGTKFAIDEIVGVGAEGMGAMKWDDNANVILIFLCICSSLSLIDCFVCLSHVCLCFCLICLPACLPACLHIVEPRRKRRINKNIKILCVCEKYTQFAATHRFDLIWYHADIGMVCAECKSKQWAIERISGAVYCARTEQSQAKPSRALSSSSSATMMTTTTVTTIKEVMLRCMYIDKAGTRHPAPTYSPTLYIVFTNIYVLPLPFLLLWDFFPGNFLFYPFPLVDQWILPQYIFSLTWIGAHAPLYLRIYESICIGAVHVCALCKCSV